MQMKVSSTNVGDKRNARTDGCNICKVLLRTDAEIYTRRLHASRELCRNRGKLSLVRQEVVRRSGVGTEKSIGLRDLSGQRPEFSIGERSRQPVVLRRNRQNQK